MTVIEEAKKAALDAMYLPPEAAQYVSENYLVDSMIDGAFARLSELGYVVVPKKASEEMEWAALDVEISPSRIDGGHGAPDGEEIKVLVREIYAAMVAASPHSIHPQQGDKPKRG